MTLSDMCADCYTAAVLKNQGFHLTFVGVYIQGTSENFSRQFRGRGGLKNRDVDQSRSPKASKIVTTSL